MAISFILQAVLLSCGLGITKAFSDLMAHDKWATKLPRFTNSFYNNVSITWRNKYKDGNVNSGERFPLSTTLLVAFTDGWHLFNMLNQVCLFLLFILLLTSSTSLVVAFLISTAIVIIRTITFHIVYTYL
jgi:hypothetical protein